MAKICKNEQDGSILIKERLLTLMSQLYKRGHKDKAMKLLPVFDMLPSLVSEEQVDIRCKVCTFPECDHADSIKALANQIPNMPDPATAEALPGHLMESTYLRFRRNILDHAAKQEALQEAQEEVDCPTSQAMIQKSTETDATSGTTSH